MTQFAFMPDTHFGVYGRPLLKQHGAPIRLVVPWKYGYKSIKSIERIELTDHEPVTFWSTLNPAAYPFESNVDPNVPRPWNQSSERMLGSDQRLPVSLTTASCGSAKSGSAPGWPWCRIPSSIPTDAVSDTS